MSKITIFSHKHFNKKIHHKFDIFHKPLMLVHIINQMAKFEVIMINFEKNSNCDQKWYNTQILQILYYLIFTLGQDKKVLSS